MAKQNGASHGPRTVATNRKARHEYFIEETYEAGIALTGTEIKSVRAGRVSLQDGFVLVKTGEAWLLNVHIAPY
ncbi:MAG: SsrA-binding protein, partial [Caldilineaceae bacterium]|nr:SsrA-binding protein [Caldilineaceae bacterium]